MIDADDPYIGGQPSPFNDDWHGQRERALRRAEVDITAHYATAVNEGVIAGAELALRMAKMKQPLARDIVAEIKDMLARREKEKSR